MSTLTDLPEEILYKIFDYFRENKFINLCKIVKIEIDFNSFTKKIRKQSKYAYTYNYFFSPHNYYWNQEDSLIINTNFDLRRTIESIHNYTLRKNNFHQKISKAIRIIKKTKKKTFSKNEKYEHKSNIERQHKPFKNVKMPKRKWQN